MDADGCYMLVVAQQCGDGAPLLIMTVASENSEIVLQYLVNLFCATIGLRMVYY